MSGKILNIVANDLYGNVDERKVVIFACFEHIKYMNNYVIFSFQGEYGKKKLGYGSIHLKNDSLVIFAVKDNVKKYIEEFIDEYMADKLDDYKLLEIKQIEKVELVSYSEMNYDKLDLLDEKSIERKDITETDKKIEKKPIILYLFIFILILISIGITLLYFFPDMFAVKYKELDCSINAYDEKMMLNYDLSKNIKFDTNDKVTNVSVVKTYIFLDSNSYYNFRDNNRHEDYFSNGEGYKYIDKELKFKLFYDEDYIIDDYDEMLSYLKMEGFICIEKEYEK